MKTLQESIIGRKGSPIKFTKDMLESGYIVKYRSNPYSTFGMYFSLEDVEKYQDTLSHNTLSHVITHLRKNNDIGVFISKEKRTVYPGWSPLSYYSEDLLCSEHGGSDFDVIEIYPVKTKPVLLDQKSLEHLTKGIAPIKINQ